MCKTEEFSLNCYTSSKTSLRFLKTLGFVLRLQTKFKHIYYIGVRILPAKQVMAEI